MQQQLNQEHFANNWLICSDTFSLEPIWPRCKFGLGLHLAELGFLNSNWPTRNSTFIQLGQGSFELDSWSLLKTNCSYLSSERKGYDIIYNLKK